MDRIVDADTAGDSRVAKDLDACRQHVEEITHDDRKAGGVYEMSHDGEVSLPNWG